MFWLVFSPINPEPVTAGCLPAKSPNPPRLSIICTRLTRIIHSFINADCKGRCCSARSKNNNKPATLNPIFSNFRPHNYSFKRILKHYQITGSWVIDSKNTLCVCNCGVATVTFNETFKSAYSELRCSAGVYRAMKKEPAICVAFF